ncbi:tRNA-specific adenosine deaminase [Marinobacter nauticus ATCC 49840]|uniref:nucleoside deaminase n=1 Tax=Marinobacter nauticus TaxID=2743 RepID=UPI000256E9F3|nr:nucleoside deaminase [Marinobacter nauticus]CCG95428.1 tRNA-specific adenosine deaminase [Marinobacter nauticus ATCC 49840]
MCEFIAKERLTESADIAIDLAVSSVKANDLPFSAIILDRNGDLIGQGINQVAEHLDCTAHAEIQAIREASRTAKEVSLRGTTLIASGEPCALCYMAIRMAGIEKVVVLSNRYEAQQHGFNYLWTYQYLNESLFQDIEVLPLDHERKLLPFQLAQMN